VQGPVINPNQALVSRFKWHPMTWRASYDIVSNTRPRQRLRDVLHALDLVDHPARHGLQKPRAVGLRAGTYLTTIASSTWSVSHRCEWVPSIALPRLTRAPGGRAIRARGAELEKKHGRTRGAEGSSGGGGWVAATCGDTGGT